LCGVQCDDGFAQNIGGFFQRGAYRGGIGQGRKHAWKLCALAGEGEENAHGLISAIVHGQQARGVLAFDHHPRSLARPFGQGQPAVGGLQLQIDPARRAFTFGE